MGSKRAGILLEVMLYGVNGIRILGPLPSGREACSGYLVRSEGARVLLDCGHAVFSILQKYQDFRELDAVIISHFHPDHYVDLYALRHAIRGAMFQGRRKHPLRLLIPTEPAPLFDYWSDTQEFCTEAIAGEIVVGDLRISFSPTVHSMPGYSMVVEDSRGRRLVYTGDTDYIEERLSLAEGAELLVAEASIRIRTGSMHARPSTLPGGRRGAGLLYVGCRNYW